MISFTQNFEDDLAELLAACLSTEPVGLIRFGDGESAILRQRERPFVTHREGETWDSRNISEEFRLTLLEALRADVAGLCVATICPACSGQSSEPLRREVRCPRARQTYAEIFGNANWSYLAKYVRTIRRSMFLVSSAKGANLRIPTNMPEHTLDFHQSIVDELLKVRKPIALAAGPSACVLGHWYWEQAEENRQTCLDVGALFDQQYWGNTRHYMPEGSARGRRVCTWDGSGVGLDTD